MNILLQNRTIPNGPQMTAPQVTVLSKAARAWALLASLLAVAISVNAAVILANGV